METTIETERKVGYRARRNLRERTDAARNRNRFVHGDANRVGWDIRARIEREARG